MRKIRHSDPITRAPVSRLGHFAHCSGHRESEFHSGQSRIAGVLGADTDFHSPAEFEMGYNRTLSVVTRSMDTQASREIQFDGIHCTLAIQKFARGVVILRISGTDIGEFRDAPMLELKECLTGMDPVHLFIDAREVRGASLDVSGEWAGWLRTHKTQLREISMLTGSRFVEVTADFVRRFADLQGIMRIYKDAPALDASLAEALS